MADYLTVVIRLPDDLQQRERITSELRIGDTFHGGRVTGLSLEDEMTLAEMLGAELGDLRVDEARERVKALHRQAESTDVKGG